MLKKYRTLWLTSDEFPLLEIIDQRYLPHETKTQVLENVPDAVAAIRDMQVRGAPLIGITAAFGMYLAVLEDSSDTYLNQSALKLKASRPTAVNLSWAVDLQLKHLLPLKPDERIKVALDYAIQLADDDVDQCRLIGEHGLQIIQKIAQNKKVPKPINIMTHCNAGWLACLDWGTATSPIYHAHKLGMDIHIWVSETRPRNQGASLTAWELSEAKVPHTIIADNACGHLMQKGLVDIVIVGSDRTTASGDVCNKIGTYLKALAAKANHIPFYAALPSSTIDWTMDDGLKEIPIEERDEKEVTHIQGLTEQGLKTIQVTPKGSSAKNYGFDVTPRELITGIITERGICKASPHDLATLFPDKSLI